MINVKLKTRASPWIDCLQEVFTVEMNKNFEDNGRKNLEFMFDQIREQTEDEIMGIFLV